MLVWVLGLLVRSEEIEIYTNWETLKDIMTHSPVNSMLLQSIRLVISDARISIIRQVSFTQIISNWVVGKMIVEDEQNGSHTAEYGKQIIKYLSSNLTKEFGSGYSATNLKYYRQFYLEFTIQQNKEMQIGHAVSDESAKSHAVSDHLKDEAQNKYNTQLNKNSLLMIEIQNINNNIQHPLSDVLKMRLSWTHHRILLKVNNKKAKQFYLKEADENNWSTRALERQVNSLYYERIISSQNEEEVKREAIEKTQELIPEDLLKDPMVLEFLQLKKDRTYLESELEEALLNNINHFLLELGKGFAFVARQKRITTQTKSFYVDLVFYNYLLKCFVLIDLKTRELTHGDIGQMDMYVRYFEDKEKGDEDNPTIGIIMATEKDDTVVKYSVLNDNKQLFATKYKLYLPTADELKMEIEQSKLNYKLNTK